MNKISIIIPVLNEAKTIGNLLQHLLDSATIGNIAEIIVVDGGSTDDTQTIISSFTASGDSHASQKIGTNILLLHSKKGRAKQMNTGAENTTGSILYFLHADSFPPVHFDQLVIDHVKQGHNAGCFKMKFDHSHWWLRLAGWLTQFKWRACRGGDQSQFITKTLFDELGGFDERFIIYEDNDLINKLYARNEFVVIQEWLTTSARRYEANGVWKLQYHFWAIYVKKWLGASAEELLRYYQKNIA